MSTTSSRTYIGYSWCLFFVFMEAIQTVYYGSVLQTINPYLFGAVVLGVSSIGAILVSMWRDANQLRIFRRSLRTILYVNLFGTLSWICYLNAIRFLEPAVALTVFSAAIPLTIVFLERPLLYRIGVIGVVCILLSILGLGIISTTGFSGFTVYSSYTALLSIIGCTVAGSSISIVLLLSKRLNKFGMSSLSVFGVRFVLFTLISMGMYLVADSDGEQLTMGNLWILLIGVVLIAIPLYAVQKAIEISSPRAVSIFTAFSPVGVVVLQIYEGRVSFSLATLMCIFIYTAGTVLLASNEIRQHRLTL